MKIRKKPISRIYRTDRLCAITDGSNAAYGRFETGTVIYIFGKEVYNDKGYTDE